PIRNARKLFVGSIERTQNIFGMAHDKDLLFRHEELAEPFKPVGHDRRTAGRRLEEASRRAIADARHRIARDVQRETRTRVERRMVVRRYMLEMAQVCRPLGSVRVHRSGKNEDVSWAAAYGLEKQCF